MINFAAEKSKQQIYNISNGIKMEVITMESSASKKADRTVAEIVQYVRLAKWHFKRKTNG